ncbi:DUF1871 family protein [Metabacillus indicus]|jgi:hypothetical protein|uniref:DUF1871 family protein n=1 Tax=Metabacillus indicus TaxID=246786 RepID=UPI003CEA8E03
MREANEQMLGLLYKWDPLKYGAEAYETEVFDVLQAVHVSETPAQLSRKIQAVYEFSFEEIIPLKECEKMAVQLMVIKNNAACER